MPVRPTCLLLVLAVLFCADRGPAQEAEEATAFPVRTLPFPRGIDLRMDARPPLPGADAGEAVWVERVREDTKLVRDILARIEVVLPEHSAALMDPVNRCIALRTMVEPMEVIEASLHQFVASAPETLALHFEGFRVDDATARRVALESAARADASAARARLVELEKAGLARRLAPVRIETRSGYRTQAGSGGEDWKVKRVAMDAEGNVFTETAPLAGGAHVEIDPVLGPDRQTLDLNVSFQRSTGVRQRALALGEMAGRSLETPVLESQMGRVLTSTTIKSGMTELFSIWPVGDAGTKDGHEVTFLHAEAVKVVPELPEGIEKMLLAHADKAVEPRPELRMLPAPDDGMSIRKYRVTPIVLWGDPRSALCALQFGPASKPELTRATTTMEGLKSIGIPFPPGASATYFASDSMLIVRHSHDQLDAVESYLKELTREVPLCLQVTLFIAEVDAAAAREMMGMTAKVADHTAAFRSVEKLALEGRAEIPVVLCHLGRSGIAAEAFSALGYATAESLPQSEEMETGAEIRERRVGTVLKTEGVIQPDLRTVNMEYELEHHFAPPSPADQSEGTPDASFHCAKVKGGLVFSSGMMKLVGVWKPEGAPDHEGKDVMQAAFLRVDLVPVKH